MHTTTANKMSQRFFGIALAFLLTLGSKPPAAGKPAGAVSEAERAAMSRVSVEVIREVTARLSAPAMEGRGTAQPGGDRAAQYIAARYAALGLKPLGDAGSFFQSIRFHTSEVRPESALTIYDHVGGDITFSLGKDFVFASPLPKQSVSITSGLVFAGFGVVSKDLHMDALAPVDPKGKIVMIITGKPKAVDQAAWKKIGGVQASMEMLARRGAAAVLVVADADSYASIADRYGRRRVSLAGADQSNGIPVVYVSPAAAARVIEGTGSTLAGLKEKAEAGESVSREIPRRLTISLAVAVADGTSNNVAGVFEGSDPRLKSEAVVFTAHYDAFGIAANGKIYPGAADNALGVAEMLAVAGAITGSSEKPRRSVIFIAVTGEEYGLLGSRYWVEHPAWPLSRIAADVNFDGVGAETYGPVKNVSGFGAEYSDLGKVLRGVAADTDSEIIPDPVPEQRVFYRSDQYSFASRGVPAVNILGLPSGDSKAWIGRIFAWVATSYHQPGDVIHGDWNWDGPRTLAVLGLLTGLRVANADEDPNWLPSAPFKREP